MTDAELIARLRDTFPGSLMPVAADRIEALLAERSAMIANVAMARERAEKAEAEVAALKHEIRATRKQWCGRDYDHLPLPEAVGAATQARERQCEQECERLQHDIARHIQIAADLAQENEELRDLLTDLRPHWDGFTHKRIFTANIAGELASIRRRMNLFLATRYAMKEGK